MGSLLLQVVPKSVISGKMSSLTVCKEGESVFKAEKVCLG